MNPTVALLDVGTSRIKGALLEKGGRRLAFHERPGPPLSIRGNRVTQDPELVLHAVREILSELPDWKVLGLTTQRGTRLWVDALSHALGPLQSWLHAHDDPAPPGGRLRSLASWLAEQLGAGYRSEDGDRHPSGAAGHAGGSPDSVRRGQEL